MSNDMKCPFCQQELVQEGSNNYWCKKCNLERYSPALYGSQKLWQELIRTRKALDLAFEMLKDIKNDPDTNDELTQEIADRLDEITALEQKDVK